jgi:DNA mismatch repair protein MutS2
MVDDVVDKYGEIKDNASPDLLNIRRGMNAIRGKSELWNRITHYNSLGYLDDIREFCTEGFCSSLYRRKVKGSIMGSSKTGSIAYIERSHFAIF